jgi:hypothetical protein
MTKTNMDLSELLAKQDGGDFLRAVAEAVLQLIMEADVEGLIGAGKHERADQRTTWRNGYRERALDTRLGTLNLKVPKLRQGSYFPGFLEPRKTSEKALVAVIQEAWIGGVSTRRVDELGPSDIGERIFRSGGARPPIPQMIAFIDDHRGVFGGEPLMRHWFKHNGEPDLPGSGDRTIDVLRFQSCGARSGPGVGPGQAGSAGHGRHQTGLRGQPGPLWRAQGVRHRPRTHGDLMAHHQLRRSGHDVARLTRWRG